MNNKNLLLYEAVETIRDLRNEIEDLKDRNEFLEKKLMSNEKIIALAKKTRAIKIYQENQDYAK